MPLRPVQLLVALLLARGADLQRPVRGHPGSNARHRGMALDPVLLVTVTVDARADRGVRTAVGDRSASATPTAEKDRCVELSFIAGSPFGAGKRVMSGRGETRRNGCRQVTHTQSGEKRSAPPAQFPKVRRLGRSAAARRCWQSQKDRLPPISVSSRHCVQNFRPHALSLLPRTDHPDTGSPVRFFRVGCARCLTSSAGLWTCTAVGALRRPSRRPFSARITGRRASGWARG